MIRITPPSTKLLVLSLMFFGLFAFGQTAKQAQQITASYNKTHLQNLAAKSLETSTREKSAAVQYALARNIPISYTKEDGTYSELQRVLADGTLLYYETNNVDAAKSTRTNHINTGGSTGYNLNGENMMAYVWDGGHPRVTHQEFDGLGGTDRVSIMDTAYEKTQNKNHATHVIGTITATGIDPLAKGMAPQSNVKAYEWTNDLAEATLAASNGMLLSNHSYGYSFEGVSAQLLGAYGERSHNWDNLLFNAPYYLMINSAGNNGLKSKPDNGHLADGYDKLSGFGTSKNNLVVAAAKDASVNEGGNFISAVIYPESSQGPTDDLRIKPDITGNGVGVYSTYAGADDAYNSISGTSMAAPNVTGSLLLLQQHYNRINEKFMRAATLKGLALHTADDAGPVGPDAVWGWGLLNAKKAAETITQNGTNSLVQELVITQGETIVLTVNSDEINKLIASISWTDRAGAINTATNSNIAALVNDLDIRVQKSENIYYPWRLTSATSNSNDGDNTKDPYERVDVENATGSYTITITHKGTLVGGSQAFSLIVTGVQIECIAVSVPENIEVLDVNGTSALISWNLFPEALFDLQYREVGASSWVDIPDIDLYKHEITGLNLATDYELQVRSKCPQGQPSEYSEIMSFSTLDTIEYCDSQSEDNPNANELFHISNVKLNTIDNTSGKSNYTDFTDVSTDLVAGKTYDISLTTASDGNLATSYSVWIDYNGNGRFDFPGEQIFAMTTTDKTIASGSFTIPEDVMPLSTRMRVSMTNSSFPAMPCDIFDFGEVEDYTINLIPYHNFVYENDTWTPSDPSGNSISSDNILIINGTATLNADTDVNNITVMSGAILKVENNLTIHGTMVFKSTAEGNGELAAVPESATILGNVTVERYMSNRRSYRMVTSAVSTSTSIHANWQEGANVDGNSNNPSPGFGTHITGDADGLRGFDATATGNASMYYVPNGTQQFQVMANTDETNLTAGKAYLMFVRGDRGIDLTDNHAQSSTTLRATGSLVTGDQTQSFAASSGDGDHFVMFGNPYQSAVDITSVFANSTEVNGSAYYIYDPAKGTNGGYVLINLTDGDGTNEDGSTANKYLQPGQAAQVVVSGAASVIFNEADKAPGNFTTSNRNPMSGSDKLIVQLYTTENFNNEGSIHDSFVMRFAEDYDNELTSTDALKAMNFYENLAIDHNGTYLGLERREMPHGEEVYPLYSSGYNYTDYTLKMMIDGLDETFLYLDDTFTNTSTLLEVGETVYSFSVDKTDELSIATDRFSIRTEARLGVEDNNILAGVRLYPNPLNDATFYIHAPKLNGEQVEVKISDMAGRQIFNDTLGCQDNRIAVSVNGSLTTGVYLVTVKFAGEESTYRLMKK